MARAPVDQYERVTKDNRKGATFCACGKPVGTRGHNGAICRFWRHSSPSPGRGQLPAWMIPMRLYKSHADDDGGITYLSPELERYLTLWCGRYSTALGQLADWSPAWYRTFVAVMHEERRLVDLSREWGVPLGTVKSQKYRSIRWMRERVGDSRDWEHVQRARLDDGHDPSTAGYKALIAELIRSNAPKAAA